MLSTVIESMLATTLIKNDNTDVTKKSLLYLMSDQ